jgi:endonuclease G, mitochondrial
MRSFQLRLAMAIGLMAFVACEKEGKIAVAPPASTPDTIRSSIPGQPSQQDSCGTYVVSTADNDNMLLGNPTNAQPCISFTTNYLLNETYYAASYNSQRGTPNWTCWHLQASDVGSAGRSDDFAANTELPSSFFVVDQNGYSGSGFDRGHNCPSGDRTSTVTANEKTFLMTNMIPQAPNNNQKTWANFEDYTRNTLAGTTKECYVIMGSYGTGGIGSNGAANTVDNGHVTVPKRVWKVVVVIPAGNSDLGRIDENTTVVAIDTPNDNGISSDWKQYITTVKAIEDSTGYTLLSALPANVQTALKAKVYQP